MKNLAKVITLILAVSFIATGCNLLNKEEKTSTETQVVNADTVLDQQIFQRALSMKDLEACATIKNAATKTECEDVVNALVLTDKAIAKVDDDFCGDIKLERYEQECEASVVAIVDQQKKDEQQQEDIAKKEENRQKIEQEAITKGDYKICDKLGNKQSIASCQYNTLGSEAINTNKEELCEKIELAGLVELCKTNVRDFNNN